MKFGVLGGTFDPPHAGHLAFAKAAIGRLELDEVLLLPAYRNPIKTARSASAKDRLEMVRRMAEGEPKLSVSDIEITRGGASYMVETLMELQMVRPGDYWLLLGADALRSFEAWKNPRKILKLCRLGVAIRPPFSEADAMRGLSEEIREKVDLVPMKPIDISSTELRARLEKGSGLVRLFLSAPVIQYIKQSHLYGA
ncbi:MAG TPA: nicotinate-nucleotide adenylyltransferase [Fimbriimonadaceae bacterium]|nr:nicotinate-nucleotide adenylyltransferase [Fimbriimonadaceae bacterium]